MLSGRRLPAFSAILATAVVLVVSGCADTPSGSALHVVKGGSSQVKAYVVPEPPPPPGKGWTPQDVVLGFLNASASFADNSSAARAYLVPSLRAHWHPGAVTIVGTPGRLKVVPYERITGGSGQPTEYQKVMFTGQRLATLSQSGQYLDTPGSTVYPFTLAQVKGVWLIESVPDPDLRLLTQTDFQEVYQPRNLYYFVAHPSSNLNDLVPDPVFAPIQGNNSALNTTLATGLVNGLLNGHRGSWQSAATTTEFPAGTKLLSLSISNGSAEVNLGGSADKAQPWQVNLMEDQLVATLTTKSGYAPPVASRLQLEIDGKPQYTGGLTANLVPVVDAELSPPPLYFATDTGISELAKPGQKPAQVLSFAEASPPITTVSAIAASPIARTSSVSEGKPAQPDSSELAVAVPDGQGCDVYVGQPGKSVELHQFTRFVLSASGGRCTSLSFDSRGHLWVTSATDIWFFLRPGAQPVRIAAPDMPGTNSSSYKILALRMAPDSVRAALMVQAGSARRLLLTAVSYSAKTATFGPAVTVGGNGLTNPVAVSWYNPYYLAVLAGQSIYQVPLTGGAGTQLGSAPSGATTLGSSGTHLVVSTPDGLMISADSSINWANGVKSASDPAYPG
jgi:two-component system sensor histidine kinase MtrB